MNAVSRSTSFCASFGLGGGVVDWVPSALPPLSTSPCTCGATIVPKTNTMITTTMQRPYQTSRMNKNKYKKRKTTHKQQITQRRGLDLGENAALDISVRSIKRARRTHTISTASSPFSLEPNYLRLVILMVLCPSKQRHTPRLSPSSSFDRVARLRVSRTGLVAPPTTTCLYL